MAFDFPASTALANVGSGSALFPATGAMLTWVYPDVLDTNHMMYGRINAGLTASNVWMEADGSGNLQFSMDGSSLCDAISSDAPLSTGSWQCVAVRWSFGSQAPEIFHGNGTTPLAEVASYSQQNQGATKTDIDSDACSIGNLVNLNTIGFDGRIGIHMLFDTNISLDELVTHQLRSRNAGNVEGWWIPGFNGLTDVPDYSGNGHTGTIVGSPTVADHVPLANPFGFIAEPAFSVPVAAAAAGTILPQMMQHAS